MPRATTARLFSALAFLCLPACAYPEYVNDDYRYIPLTTFAPDTGWWKVV